MDPEAPLNLRAAEILGELHDALEEGGYTRHQLERFLVRILFCLFADDTGIFDPDSFKILVKSTRTDGGDLGPVLACLFKVLNTDKAERSSTLSNVLRDLPYVSGRLFHDDLGFADFNASMRAKLLKCCDFNWSRISPAVFGSLFQSIMAGEEGRKKRRQIGAHYTSEQNILKLVRSLFLDNLRAELAKCGKNKKKLRAFHEKIASLRFLDPACGCGNFLVITYRELRLLELEVLLVLHGGRQHQQRFVLDSLLKVDVDQMYGIEIEEWPARIAEVAMWLIDHQMNQKVGEAFGAPVLRVPLEKRPKILVGNALRTDWNSVLPAKECSFVLGNPPFVGKQFMTVDQNAEMEAVCGSLKGFGLLDYVTAWFITVAEYMRGFSMHAAFVSTNSICQGEQAAILWPVLLARGVRIHFAHRTFRWMNEARGKAHVHVVIVGFGMSNSRRKAIIDSGQAGARGTGTSVKNISPYLLEGPDLVVTPRATTLCDAPPIVFGSMPNDGGHLLLSDEEKCNLLHREPAAKPFVRRLCGSEEFINGINRWCLWLVDCAPGTWRRFAEVRKRVAAVRSHRLASKRETTRRLAGTPTLFGEIRQPKTKYLLIPRVSSETRRYIPIGFCNPDMIASDATLVIPGASFYHFGVLTSEMHMAWVRQVCGRLKSDFRYSNRLVYNNFPWPQSPIETHKADVEAAAREVLAVRKQFNRKTLAELYDPHTMPKDLAAAHMTLDRAVDRCYRSAPFMNERARLEYLFALYQRLVAPLTVQAKRS